LIAGAFLIPVTKFKNYYYSDGLTILNKFPSKVITELIRAIAG